MIPKLKSKSGLEDRFCCFYWLEGGRPCAVATGPPSLGLVQSDLPLQLCWLATEGTQESDCCEYQDLQSAKSHFKCLRPNIAIHINLFYTFRRPCLNGGTIYLRCLILFCGFYYKGSFAVCCCTIGVVIEYAFGDGISISWSDSCNPTVSPPSPVS